MTVHGLSTPGLTVHGLTSPGLTSPGLTIPDLAFPVLSGKYGAVGYARAVRRLLNAADELRGTARRRRSFVPRTERRIELLYPGPVRFGVVTGHHVGVVEDAVLFESGSARRLDARIQRRKLQAGVVAAHGAGHDFGHAAIVNGGPGAETVLQFTGPCDAHVAGDHAGLGFHDAVQVRDV
ncbi:MAG: hypothetical protein F4014_03620 [Gemmatimonadetes bacterium]|nr:hypothetical protein [Gemmatimonadota bacterium]MYH19317.1 hypothetical protein [Gemmatimonadota bacterium]MYK97912.1 hypothetical protein [Gemmatimonadota bacterium]